MMKSTIIVTLPKPRNPLHKDLEVLGQRVFKKKKGKGSYKRIKSVTLPLS
jgi:hypothetical protein